MGHATIDGWVLLFTLAVAVLAGLLFGLVPASRLSRPDVTEALNESGRGHTSSHARQTRRRALVVAQLGCSMVLVVAAGLLLRSLAQLYRVDLGFNPKNVLTARIQLPLASYPRSPAAVAFYRELTQRVERLPGVIEAGAVRVLPLAQNIGDWSITVEGRPYVREENPNGDFQWVTPGYFKVMGTTLLRGRLLADDDREKTPLVVVINDTMAERYWPGEDAIGKRFHMGGVDSKNPKLTVVGIVRTARHNAVTEAPRAEMYLAHAQLSESIGGAAGWPMALVIKTTGDPMVTAASMREVLRSMDRNLPVSDVRTMEQVTANALAAPRFAALLLSVFAALALALAAIGVYGTISLLVTERTKEIGIRMALGARRTSIGGLILREGLTLIILGAAAGIAGALLATRVLSSLLYGVDRLDPVTFVAAPALLVVVSLFACFIPARRAVSVDPVVTLRAN